jgi:hypothetical protein
MSPRSLGRPLSVVPALIGLWAAPAIPASRTWPLAGIHAAALERARQGAVRKLEQPDCQRVLRDFKDDSGRSLAERLAGFGPSAADYLRMIPFLDGSSHAVCRGGRAELFAAVGVPRVYVCPSFVTKQIRDPWAAENMVIHEMLHTLGLGENPPASAEITCRVNDRCQ